MADMESALSLARQKLGETTDKYGFPARLGWKSTDTTTIYNDATGGKTPRYRVRLGTQGEVRVIAVAPGMDVPDDVYDLEVRVAYQDGTLVLIDWDRGSPLIPPAGGGVPPHPVITIGAPEDMTTAGGAPEIAQSLQGSAPYLSPPRALAALTTSTFVLGWRVPTSTNQLRIRALTVSGSTITWGTEVVIGTNVHDYNIVRVTDTTFCLGYRNNTTGALNLVAGSVSGTTITLGSAQQQSVPVTNIIRQWDIASRNENGIWMSLARDEAGTFSIALFYVPISGTTMGTKTGSFYVSSGNPIGQYLTIAGITDTFVFMAQMDPSTFPSSVWVNAYYFNGTSFTSAVYGSTAVYRHGASYYTQTLASMELKAHALRDGLAAATFTGMEFGLQTEIAFLVGMDAYDFAPQVGPLVRYRGSAIVGSSRLCLLNDNYILHSGVGSAAQGSHVGLFEIAGTNLVPSTMQPHTAEGGSLAGKTSLIAQQFARLSDASFLLIGRRDNNSSNLRITAYIGTVA